MLHPIARRLAASAILGAAVAAAADAGTPAAFTEEAAARGLVYEIQGFPALYGSDDGFGCGFADLDGDGDVDIVVLGDPDASVGVFENDGAGHFVDRSPESGIPVLEEGSALAMADYDGDGRVDLYLTQYDQANVLLRNDGDFRFTDVTTVAGVGDDGPGAGACWGDYDGDGWLDLYVANYTISVPSESNRLYRNRGDGTFEDVSVAQGVDDPGYGFQAVWFDYDRDGDVDLYLSNDRGHLPPHYHGNQLWRNDGGALVNVTELSGAGVQLYSMGLACGDFDNNGWADLYVTNIATSPSQPPYFYNPLLLNQGDGTFVEAGAAMGVENPWTSWGCIFFDWDNDARMDLYVNNMWDDNAFYVPDPDDPDGYPCVNIAADVGLVGTDCTPPYACRSGVSFASAVGDVDGDGDLEVLESNLGSNVQLYVNNEGRSRRFMRYRVEGLWPNLHAIGAMVETRTGPRWQLREVLAGGNGYLGQNDLTVHVGLDDAAVADATVVRWPGGTPMRTITGLPADQTWTLHPPDRLGDADGDGVRSATDLPTLEACLGRPFAPGCEIMDLDGDADVDAADAAAFFERYDGELLDCDLDGQPDLLQIVLDPEADADGTLVLDACEEAGDLDGSGAVDVDDLLALLLQWGPCPDAPAACNADLDDSGTVDVDDLVGLLLNWGGEGT